MTDKEFKRLSRSQLIDIIYQLQLKQEELTADNEKLSKALADKRLRVSKTGNIAEIMHIITMSGGGIQSMVVTVRQQRSLATKAYADAAVDALRARLESGSEADAGLHLGFFVDANGYLCQVAEEDNTN